jgi:hypothetical protein
MEIKAQRVQRSSEISDEERDVARSAISAFNKFLKQLWAARQHDQRLVNVLQKNKESDPAALFEIRHLLRRFQKEVRNRYANLIIAFAGKKDAKSGDPVTTGYIHTLSPLSKDTMTRQIKLALQDAVQQLTEFMEEFLEAFEDFNNQDQIAKIVSTSKKADQIVQSIENIIDSQLKPHFEKNILKRRKISMIRNGIRRRVRIINILEA